MSHTETVPSRSPRCREVATMRLGDRLLGVDIGSVREINRVGRIAPIPDADAAVRGVVNLRGDVVTVLDLRVILQLEPAEMFPRSRLAVVQIEDEPVALLVDAVEDVLLVSDDERECLPANAGEVETAFFDSVYKLESELLILLDVHAALGGAPVAM